MDQQTSSPGASEKSLAKIELIIGSLLRYGVILCALVIAAGIALSFLAPGTMQPPLATVIHDLVKGGLVPAAVNPFLCGPLSACFLNPDTVITAGLVLLIALPIARVGLTMVAFAAQRDWIYTVISVFVLVVLLAGILLGKEL